MSFQLNRFKSCPVWPCNSSSEQHRQRLPINYVTKYCLAEILLCGSCGYKRKGSLSWQISRLCAGGLLKLVPPAPSISRQQSRHVHIDSYKPRLLFSSRFWQAGSMSMKAACDINETWNRLHRQEQEDLLEKTKPGHVLTSKSEETANFKKYRWLRQNWPFSPPFSSSQCVLISSWKRPS